MEEIKVCLLHGLQPYFELIQEVVHQGKTENSVLPDPTLLKQRFYGASKYFVQFGQKHGMDNKAIEYAQYALVATLDELVMRHIKTYSQKWVNQPLQLELFEETNAGINFFIRLKELLGRKDLNPGLLEIYFICIELGFCGYYLSPQNPELTHIKNALKQRLFEQLDYGKNHLILTPTHKDRPKLHSKFLSMKTLGKWAFSLLLFTYLCLQGLISWQAYRDNQMIRQNLQGWSQFRIFDTDYAPGKVKDR